MNESLGRYFYYFKNLDVKDIILSKLFFRELHCPENCGACCFNISLDYFEGWRWEQFKNLYPEKVKRFTKKMGISNVEKEVS